MVYYVCAVIDKEYDLSLRWWPDSQGGDLLFRDREGLWRGCLCISCMVVFIINILLILQRRLIDIRNRRSISLLLVIRFLLVKRWNVIRVHTLQMHYTNRLLKFILVLMRKSVHNCQSIDQVVVMVMESEVVLVFLIVSVVFGQHQCFLQLVDLAIAVTKTDRELYFVCIMWLSNHLNRIEDLEQIA